MILRVSDIIEDIARFVDGSGVDPSCDRERVIKEINRATRELMDDGDWPGAEAEICLDVNECCITLDERFESIRAAAPYMGNPMTVYSSGFKFLHGGAPFSCCGPVYEAIEDLGDGYATHKDPATASHIVAFSDKQEADDACLEIRGIDGNNKEVLRSIHIRHSHAASAPPAYTGPDADHWTDGKYSRVTELRKPRTNGYVYVYAYNPDTKEFCWLTTIRPDTISPSHRRYRIPGGDQCAQQIVAKVALRFYPVYRDDDVLLIQHQGSLERMVQSLACLDNKDMAGYQSLRNSAISRLKKRLEKRDRSGKTGLNIKVQGTPLGGRSYAGRGGVRTRGGGIGGSCCPTTSTTQATTQTCIPSKGDKGDKGEKGDNGLTAYQVAVAAGYSGTVDEWLASLQASGLPEGGEEGQVIVIVDGEPAWGNVEGTGDVVGPASSVDGNFAAFGGTAGKLIADSGKKASDFAAASHTHDDRYYTETEIDAALSGKSNTGHTHDDRYYTETEVDALISGISTGAPVGAKYIVAEGDATLTNEILAGGFLTTTVGTIIARSSTQWGALIPSTNGYVLTLDSTQPLGVKWAAAPGAGGGSGDVVGPASSTDNAIARFDSTTGKLLQNSSATIDDSGNLAANNFSGSSSGTNTGDETAVSIRALGFFDATNDGDGSGLDADLLDGNHASAFATAAQGALADSALQSGDNISELTNDSGFTDDQTGAEIKAAYEGEADTNAFTDAEKSKLAALFGGLNKLDATSAPTANDDSADTSGNGAFSVGSVWIDVTGDEVYRCVDATPTSAVWVNTSLTVAELAAVAISGNFSDLSGTLATAQIGNNQVTNAKLAQMAEATIKGRAASAGTGDAVDLTPAQVRSIISVEENADVTDAENVGSAINGASEKTTPVDGDKVGLIDSAASNALKWLSWSNIKATLKTYFDTLYQAANSLLSDIAGITFASGDIIYYDGSNLVKLAKGTDGEVLKLASGLPSWAAESGGGGGGSGHDYKRLSADFTTTSTSFSDVDNGSGDDLIFSVDANTAYRLEVIGPVASSTVTEAVILGVNGPTASFVVGEAAFPNASLATLYTYAIQGYDDMPTSPGNGPGGTADSSCRMNVIVSVGGTGGSLAVRLRAETGGANSVTLKAGTVAILTPITAA